MPNPYEDDSVDPDAANGDLLEELREGAKEEPEDAPEPDSVVIGDPVEEEEFEPDETPRNRKRRERGERFQSKQREDNDENAQLRAELAEIRGQLTGMQSQRVAPAPVAPAGPDRFADRRSGIAKQRKETLEAYQSKANVAHGEKRELTQEENDEFFARNEKHNSDMVSVQIEEYHATQNTPQKQAEAQLTAQYPDVMSDPKARQYAVAMHQQRSIRGEITNNGSPEEIRKIMDDTRRDLKMGSHKLPPAATDKQKSSYGSSGRSGGKGAGPKRFVFDEATKSMAYAFYNHKNDWSEQQKLQAYANMQKDG